MLIQSRLQLDSRTATIANLPTTTIEEKHVIFPKVRQILRELRVDCSALLRKRKDHSRSASLGSFNRGLSNSGTSASSSLDGLDLVQEHNVPHAQGIHSLKEAFDPITHPHRHLSPAERHYEDLIFTAGHHRAADGLLVLAA